MASNYNLGYKTNVVRTVSGQEVALSGTSTTDVMSQKAVTDELNKNECYNVTNRMPLSAGQYYDLASAIAAVPVANRKLGLKLTYMSATYEKETLTVTTAPTASGNIVITLNAVSVSIALDSAIDITPTLVATKIKSATFTGWTVSGTGETVIFTKNAVGTCSAPTFNADTTGSVAVFVRTVVGAAESIIDTQFNGSSISSWTTQTNWIRISNEKDLKELQDIDPNLLTRALSQPRRTDNLTIQYPRTGWDNWVSSVGTNTVLTKPIIETPFGIKGCFELSYTGAEEKTMRFQINRHTVSSFSMWIKFGDKSNFSRIDFNIQDPGWISVNIDNFRAGKSSQLKNGEVKFVCLAEWKGWYFISMQFLPVKEDNIVQLCPRAINTTIPCVIDVTNPYFSSTAVIEDINPTLYHVNASYQIHDSYLYLGQATISTVPSSFGINDRAYYYIDIAYGDTTLPNFGGLVISGVSEPSRYLIMWNGSTWNAVFNMFKNNTESTEFIRKEASYRNFLTQVDEVEDLSIWYSDGKYTLSQQYITNDGKLYPVELLPKILQVDYKVDYSLGSSELKFIINISAPTIGDRFIVWLPIIDLLKFPSVSVYRRPVDGEVGAWFSISTYNLLNGNKLERKTENSYESIEAILTSNGYVGLVSKIKHPTSDVYMLRFDKPANGTEGTLNFQNISYIKNVEPSIYVSPINIYKKNSDCSFNARVSSVVNSLGLITTENVSTIVDEKMLNKSIDYIYKYSYGAKIQRTLKLLTDYRNGLSGGKIPKIILLGDSITGGSWAQAWKTWMEAEYNLPTDAIEIHWYGGYSHEMMIPFIDNLMQCNPDLFIYNEFEGEEYRNRFTESTIQLLRKYTSSDIAIGTWSLSSTTLTTLLNNSYAIDSTMGSFDYYRGLCRVYNCELIDFSVSMLEYAQKMIENGSTVNEVKLAFYGSPSSSPHLTTAMYNVIMLPEIKKHFGALNYHTANAPYPCNKQEEILPWESLRYNMFNDSKVTFGNINDFLNQQTSLITSIIGSELYVDLQDSIGFEILNATSTGDSSIYLQKSGEIEWKTPSSMLFKNYPLQYMTEIRSITYSSNDDTWRMKRPFMKGIVTSNVLANGILKSGQYKINVVGISSITAVNTTNKTFEVDYDLTAKFIVSYQFKVSGSTENNGTYTTVSSSYNSGTNKTIIVVSETIPSATVDGGLTNIDDTQIVVCQIIDPSLTVLTTFIVGLSDITVGSLYFPLKWNGQNNWYELASTYDNWGVPSSARWGVGDSYEFYIKSNWIDTMSNENSYNRIFGYERGDYKLKIINNSGSLKINLIRNLH